MNSGAAHPHCYRYSDCSNKHANRLAWNQDGSQIRPFCANFFPWEIIPLLVATDKVVRVLKAFDLSHHHPLSSTLLFYSFDFTRNFYVSNSFLHLCSRYYVCIPLRGDTKHRIQSRSNYFPAELFTSLDLLDLNQRTERSNAYRLAPVSLK